jgi:hypothetical protein
MKNNRMIAVGLAFSLSLSLVPAPIFAQQVRTISGTAKNQAETPYSDYVVRARDMSTGITIARTTMLDQRGNFSLTELPGPNSYLVELVRVKQDGKDLPQERIVCAEGPFDLAKQPVRSDVAISCSRVRTLAGTAKDEADKPYTDYVVRARDMMAGSVDRTAVLDKDGNFVLTDLPRLDQYLVELVQIKKDGKDARQDRIICTEGPFDLAKQDVRRDIVISCGKVPVAWWLVGAATAAGITAGVVAEGQASPSR